MAVELTKEQIDFLKEKKLITSVDLLSNMSVDELKELLFFTDVILSSDVEELFDSTDSSDSSDSSDLK